MGFLDALSITALGMSVVFGGLILTALLIVVIDRLPEIPDSFHRWNNKRDKPHAIASREKPLDPEIVTVIATVLEIEHRLHHSEHGRRLTIGRRAGHQEGQG